MLEQTFVHLSGVGNKTEENLIAAGITSWDIALASPSLPVKSGLMPIIKGELEESKLRLAKKDALWFSKKLSPADQWRLFPHFSDSVAYVDIETTGLSFPSGHITSIALFDGTCVKVYIHGQNLNEFVTDIKKYDLLVSWNGRSFDVPFIQRSLNTEIKIAHLDLYPVYRALGYKGGLKKVEDLMGIDRGDLAGVDGYMAIFLWREYKLNSNKNALETLISYNIADVISLEFLCHEACKMRGCHGFDKVDSGQLFSAAERLNTYKVDRTLVQELLLKIDKSRY